MASLGRGPRTTTAEPFSSSAATTGTGNRPAACSSSAKPIEDGLRREAREETGLDIEPVALTGVYKNMTRGIISLVFRCKITGGDLARSDEVASFRWADGAEVTDLSDEAYAVRVLDALGDTAPAVREHDGKSLM